MQLTNEELKDLEKKSVSLINKAGKIILDSWKNIGEIKYKDERDIATSVDIEVENFLRVNLNTYFPKAGFIVEEGESNETNDYNWIIDPIEGTKYYAGSVPMFFTQFALLYKREPILGVIFNPSSNQIFSASLGNGSNLNGIKITPRQCIDPSKAIIDYDFATLSGSSDLKLSIFNILVKNFYRVRLTAGFLQPYLLTGGIDAIIAFQKERSSNPIKYLIDDAPKFILFKEAGFILEEITLQNVKITVVSSPEIINHIKNILTP